ncbi:hypothetical protein VE01_02830 [Pseudogymnoascus verrucosus]|uniref:Uncharacterized protein n=1 Tax=Pseudogymnoascus verrucosus TaxID=342668 RepID=A0A1B8GUW3_9PEZI|nr:uncharacterized protein VE01_02830 [Pseudogymnoascus verrucosus]OBT99631.1 hypothetical protein VE01_02830 [Pseudogymnoascus verrucosus]
MTCDLVDPAGPVVQILLHDLEPLEGAAQYTRITSTVLFLATQGLQLHFPPIFLDQTSDPVFCGNWWGRITYTVNIEPEESDIVMEAFTQCLNHHAPSSSIMLASRHSRAWSYRPMFPPQDLTL